MTLPRAGDRFYKLSGAGNDFLALVEPPAPPGAGEIHAWCRRGLSLGADGVFTLERRADGARMVYFNADGSRGELCLNGSRCAASLAFDLGWATGELSLETDAGVLRARDTGTSSGDRIALELPDIVGEPEAKTLVLGGEAHAGWLLTVGVPHFVLPWPEGLASAPVDGLGKILRDHPDLGAAGANVNFVRFMGPGIGDVSADGVSADGVSADGVSADGVSADGVSADGVSADGVSADCELRTFERGVEAETLACGTGVVATAAAGIAAGKLCSPVTALTAGGYQLVVRGAPWVLEGDARILARGELLSAAAAVPPPPEWSQGA